MTTRSKIYKILIAAAITAVCSFLPTASAFADPTEITVDIESNLNPKSAVGIIISSSQTLQITKTRVDSGKPGTQTVSFFYDPAGAKEELYASAAIITEDGNYTFGNVKRIKARIRGNQLKTVPNTNLSLNDIPVCPPRQVQQGLSSQIAAFGNLIDIRTLRRKNREKALKQKLSDQLLVKLQRYEKGFGLSRTEELNPELNPFELADRLARLVHIITIFKTNKTKDLEK